MKVVTVGARPGGLGTAERCRRTGRAVDVHSGVSVAEQLEVVVPALLRQGALATPRAAPRFCSAVMNMRGALTDRTPVDTRLWRFS